MGAWIQMNESLFKKVLDNRAELSNKGHRVNTIKAVNNLRINLDNLAKKGYGQDDLMNLMLKHSWIGIRESWLQGKLSPRHLTTTRAVSDVIEGLLDSTHIPKPDYAKKHAHANQVRQQGLDELEKMKRLLR